MTLSNIKILNPAISARLGRVRYAVFDFDGTLSLLREGWEGVMIPLMLEMISPGQPASQALDQEVRAYVERSTGILTIRQMEWLAEAVQRYGLNPHLLSPAQYKKIYRERLLERIHSRIENLESGRALADDHMVQGSRAFISALSSSGVRLYLASGTDHVDVMHEARVLGIDSYFKGRIYGALDTANKDGAEDDSQSTSHDKEKLVRRILTENDLHGDELAVFGDGPVEIRVAAEAGALAVGVASDEVTRSGWNPAKIARLEKAGADVLIPDFSLASQLHAWIMAGV